MKKILLCALLVVAIAPTASADSLMAVSGATTVTASSSGNTSVFATINGWSLFAFGASNSPGITPFGIDLVVLATCVTGDCLTNPLHVSLSDTGFTVPVPAGGFQTSYSANVIGATATTTEVAWADSTNTLFGKGLAPKIGPPLFGVPSVGPFNFPGGFGFFVGGPGQTGAGPGYSLTIEEVFNANGSTASFSADANVFATPEPGTLTLFGAGLTSIAGLIRRKLKK